MQRMWCCMIHMCTVADNQKLHGSTGDDGGFKCASGQPEASELAGRPHFAWTGECLLAAAVPTWRKQQDHVQSRLCVLVSPV